MRFIDRVVSIAGSPTPLRTRIFRKLLTKYPMGSFEQRLLAGGFERPAYAWCVYQAAIEAKALGYRAITAIEMGVAGGGGLLLLCKYAEAIEPLVGIKINILGFDAGTGLPETSDPRDLRYCWPAGSFAMDFEKLQKRVAGRAQIVLGNVAETAAQASISAEAPIGAIMFDLDFYTSTRDAFAIFSQDAILPRIWCYFDDIMGGPEHAYSDSIGVRSAIREFNTERAGPNSHLSQAYAFKYSAPEQWHQHIYAYHRLDHPEYNKCLTDHQHTLDI